MLPVGSKSWFGRREPAKMPDLEYRTCATSSKAAAKAAAERMIGRRETYMSGAAWHLHAFRGDRESLEPGISGRVWSLGPHPE